MLRLENITIKKGNRLRLREPDHKSVIQNRYEELTEDEKIYFDERAGIYEYEAMFTRAEAEEKAYIDLSKIKFIK